MKILFTFLLLIYSGAYGQTDMEVEPLSSYRPKTENSDLTRIDSIFKEVKVVGIGECTHGTSEFTLMRHRIFKHLAETKGFNTVFIEADYGACLRVNRYINGKNDDVNEAILELRYFAWTTEEMKEFVEWMRAYNLNSDNKIQIVGCDMQSISDDKIEIKRILKINNIIDSIPDFFSTLKPPYQDTSAIRQALNDWDIFCSHHLKDQVDPINYMLIDATINQFLLNKLRTSNQYNYRDSCMALNIINYLNLTPSSKGIWMAHNGHISKTKYDYPTSYSYKTSGQFLSENLKESYVSIAQITNTGYFNAWKYIKNKPAFSICELKKAKRHSLENQLSQYNSEILFCDYSKVKNVHKMNYTEIGHTYGKTNSNYKVKRYKKLTEGKFDYVIYFVATRQTTII
jgi:erythromycin esterase